MLCAPKTPGGGGPLEWILDKVPAGSDEWSIEKLSEDVQRQLQSFASKIVRADLGIASLEEVIAKDFRSSGVVPPALERVLSEGGLTVERWSRETAPAAGSEAPQRTSPEALSAQLSACFPGVSAVAKAKFKIFQAEARPAAPEGAAATRLRTRTAARSRRTARRRRLPAGAGRCGTSSGSKKPVPGGSRRLRRSSSSAPGSTAAPSRM
jgi:hypothetical protein